MGRWYKSRISEAKEIQTNISTVFEVEAPSLDAGALAKDWEQAQSYRYQTLLYIRQALRLPCGSYQPRPDNVLITSFDDIAEHVNSVCSEGKEILIVCPVSSFQVTIKINTLILAKLQNKNRISISKSKST